MKYLTIAAFVAIVLLNSCKKNEKKKIKTNELAAVIEQVKTPALHFKWATDTLLTTSESVIYDQKREILYVSCISGKPDSVDGVGFISKVSLDGKIEKLNWISDLNAPKGMGIYEDKLYVTDLDKIIEIDIEANTIVQVHTVEGALFLNDITIDYNGKVYASDSRKGTIHVLEKSKVTMILDSLSGPNGLLWDNDKFLVALWNEKTLNILDLETNIMTKMVEDIENPDGIEAVGNGSYLVSSWQGKIHLISSDWNKVLLLDTSNDKIGAADIEYIPEKNLLLIPTFYKNGLMAYELEK